MAAPATRTRRAYIDWLRGVAVVIMILAHTTDSWTLPADRGTPAYSLIVKISGMAAPLFLYLAGLALSLSAGAKARKTGQVSAAASAVGRRGWQILGLALLFRLQSWILGLFRAPAASMLKVDILNVMGLAMAGAAAIWGLSARPLVRVVLLSGTAIAISLVTPPLRAAAWPAALPDALEWYLRPPASRSWFTLFPWAGLLFAGAATGVLVDGAREPGTERRLISGLAISGALVFGLSLWGSHLPSVYANSAFWTTSPSYFFLRVGLMTMLLALAYAWCLRPTAHRWSPMLVFGNSSLFVYWVHVELAYGGFSKPLRRALPLPRALVAFGLFTGLMLVLTILKTRLVVRWKAARVPAAGPVAEAH
jgi:uncharacterized membrane protein